MTRNHLTSVPVTALFLVACLAHAPAHALPPGFTIEAVHTNLNFPVALRFSRDHRLFYLERSTGRIMVFADPTAASPKLWATVPVSSDGERGLLGLALHPSFPDSPYVYVFHTNPSPLVNRVARLSDVGGVGIHYCVILDGLPAQSPNHHGGRLAFGPDGDLYVTYGDQANPGAAQDVNDPCGKILRISPLGLRLPDNPFGPSNPAYTMGNRNIFGLAFDTVTGVGYFTENGPTCDDEVNLLSAGGNYGWGPSDPCGSQPAGTRAALASYSPTIAPTGCAVYRGIVYPEFAGNLFFGSYNDGRLRRVVFHAGNPALIDLIETFLVSPGGGILDVTVGNDGLLWFSDVSGTIYRVMPAIVSGVAPPGAPGGLAAAPNPFLHHVALSLPTGEAIERVEIVDLNGRRVREWTSRIPAVLEWDGLDASGASAAAGIYFARVKSARRTSTLRLVRLGP